MALWVHVWYICMMTAFQSSMIRVWRYMVDRLVTVGVRILVPMFILFRVPVWEPEVRRRRAAVGSTTTM